MWEILARFNTEEQVRAAFLITHMQCKVTPHTEKIFTKTSKHEKHTRVTDCPTEQAVLSIMN
jgi:hypothetical protein